MTALFARLFGAGVVAGGIVWLEVATMEDAVSEMDPARVNDAGELLDDEALLRTGRGVGTVGSWHVARAVLTADDARARAAGLVATGDGLTVECLLDLILDAEYAGQYLGEYLSHKHGYDTIRDRLPADLRRRIEEQP